MWVAAACRSPCGPMAGTSGTAATARCTTVRATRGSRRPPRAPRSSAGGEPGRASAGRPVSVHRRSARAAGTPKTTVRSRRPCPAREGHGGRRRRRRGRDHTARPPARPSRRAARRRGGHAAAADRPAPRSSTAAASTVPAWARSRTVGNVRRARGAVSRAPGSAGSRPRRWAQRVNERAAAACRESVDRAAPVACASASQPRSRPEVERGERGQAGEQTGQIGPVRPDRVHGPSAFEAQGARRTRQAPAPRPGRGPGEPSAAEGARGIGSADAAAIGRGGHRTTVRVARRPVKHRHAQVHPSEVPTVPVAACGSGRWRLRRRPASPSSARPCSRALVRTRTPTGCASV